MKGLFKNAGLMLALSIINKILFLFLIIVIARKLGVEGMGTYSFVFAFVGLLFMPVGIGGSVVVRELAATKNKVSKYFWNALLLRATISVIVFALTVVVIYFYPIGAEAKNAAYLCGILLFFSILKAPAMLVIYSLRHFKLLFIINLIEDAVSVFLAVLFLFLGWGILGIVSGFIVGSAISTILSLAFVWKSIGSINNYVPDRVLLKRFISKGSVFLMQGLLRLGMFRTDILLVSLFSSISLVGIYGAAAKVSAAMSILPAAITTVIYPSYSTGFIHSKQLLKKDYRKILLYMVIIALFIYTFLIFFSELIVYYVYGKAFLDAVPVIKILAIATAVNSVNRNNFTFLNAIRKEKLNFYLILLNFFVNAIFDIILIKDYGLKGVAVATVFCALAYCIISTIVILKEDRKFYCVPNKLPLHNGSFLSNRFSFR